jgi:hypothetical protein
VRKEKEALEAKVGGSSEAPSGASATDREAWEKEKEELQKQLEDSETKQQVSARLRILDSLLLTLGCTGSQNSIG